ncbi:hypothetical protein [Marinicella sp. W31]|uniref:hypothetical protein n=1 Tax=Marinicella sp. W31 TaxID=3023713 RepID=UPI0037570776
MKYIFMKVMPLFMGMNSYVQANERFERERQAVMNGQINGTVVSVGIDNDCDFQIGTNTFQDAINSGAVEIRLATNATYDPVIISGNGSSLNIIGGYGDCQDANNNVRSSQKSVVLGLSGVAGLDIDGVNVNISGVQVQQADDGLRIANTSNIEVVLDNVEINNNGAGIRIDAAQVDMFAEDIRIHHNNAPNGSGINCNSAANIIIVGNSSIDNNQATIGGGAFLSGGCDLTMVGGDNLSAEAGITMNTGQQIGGGVTVAASSITSRFVGIGDLIDIEGITYGNLNEPLIISANQTLMGASVGGGIFAEGIEAEVKLTNTAILLNTANNGAGIYANNGANVTFNRSTQKCWSENGCNYLGLNGAAQAGGAVYVSGGAKLNASYTQITRNRASVGIAAFVKDQNSQLTIESSFISQNGDSGNGIYTDDNVIQVESLGIAVLVHNTIVDNNSINQVLRNDGSILALRGSYLYNPNGGAFVSTVNNGGSFFSCLLVDDANNTAVPEVNLMSSSDYTNTFVNPALGDYHTLATASGLDYCAQQITTIDRDIDNELRGYDDPNIINNNGSFDVGAHENLGSDIIFNNGFEGIMIDL